MWCLVFVAYCSLANADTFLSPSSSSQCKEEVIFTSTSTIDPWSPVVGDTDGVPGTGGVTNRDNGTYVRRAAISLVENIRRQLMHDNYDYISDPSKESSMIKTLSPTKDSTKKRRTSGRNMSIQTAMLPTSVKSLPRQYEASPAVDSITSAVLPLQRSHLLPPVKGKPLSQIQVARVDMPSKIKNKSHFTFNRGSLVLRSVDEISQRRVTTAAKNMKSEIDVSNKDLLFYVDDIHLRRNNPRSGVSSTYNIEHNVNYDINQKNRRRIQSDTKMQNHLNGKQKLVEAAEVIEINGGDHHKKSSKSLYDELGEKNHMNQDDRKNINENSNQEFTKIYQLEKSQTNVSLSPDRVYYDMMQKPRPLDVSKEIQQNNQSHREINLYDKEYTEQISNQEQYRRSIRRRNHRGIKWHKNNRNHKYVEHPNESQYGVSTNDKDERHGIKIEIKPQIKRSSKNIYSEHSPNKHKPPERPQEKKDQLIHNSNNVHSKHDNKQSHKSLQGSNRKKLRKPQLEETVAQENNESENHNDVDNSLYTLKGDKRTDNVTVKSLRNDKSSHRDRRKKVNENSNLYSKQSGYVIQNKYHVSNDVNGESIHDELKNNYDDDKNEQSIDPKSHYIDSMDNDHSDAFDDRRMHRLTNDTQLAHKPDVHDGECNNKQHDCFSKESIKQRAIMNEEQLTSPTAKYKLLKVRAAVGSRRSNAGERRFLQERGPKGVALFALDGAPFPQFRLPRSRRQYMDDQADKRPPLMEQIYRRSFNKKQSKHRSPKNED